MARPFWVQAAIMATAAAMAQQAHGDGIVCDPYQSVDEARTACDGSFRMWGQAYENSSMSFGDEVGVLTDGPYYCSSCGLGFVCKAGTLDCPPSFPPSGKADCPDMPVDSTCLELNEACSSNGFGWLEGADVGPDITGSYSCAGCYGETPLETPIWEPFRTPELVIFYLCIGTFFILATALEVYTYAKEDDYKEYYILRTLGYIDKDGKRRPCQCRCPGPPLVLALQIFEAVVGSFAISMCIENLAGGLSFLAEGEASCSMAASIYYRLDSDMYGFEDIQDIEYAFDESAIAGDTVFGFGRDLWIELLVVQAFVLLFQFGLTSLAVSLMNLGYIGNRGVNVVKIAIPLLIIILVIATRDFKADDFDDLIIDWIISLSIFLCCAGPCSFLCMRLLAKCMIANGCLKAPPQELNSGIMRQMPVSPSGYQVQVIDQDRYPAQVGQGIYPAQVGQGTYPAPVTFIDPSLNTGQVLSPNERSSAP